MPFASFIPPQIKTRKPAMEHIACWSKIPYELALCIFQNVTQDLHYAQQKQNLANFELVCKSWKSPAQRLLYEKITLSENHHGKVMDTIQEHAATIGPLVKKVKFMESFRDLFVVDVFDLLAYECPNIEELFAETIEEKYEILNNLLLTTKFSHLKRLDEDLHHRQILPIYPFAAFKYRQTLTEIYIDDEYIPGDYDSKETLIRELGHFESLKRVIVTLFMTGHRMEKILGNLRDTVDTLVFQKTQEDGNWLPLHYSSMLPNTSIKKLSITEGALHGSLHTEYFRFKFKALECFESFFTDLIEEEADIPYLDFISSIDTYNVNITINGDARRRIDNLIKHAAKKETLCKNKEFELDFDYMPPPPIYEGDPSPHTQYKWNLDLIKTKKATSVKLHYIRENTDDDPLERAMFMNDVSNWLALYSPTVVRIYNIEPMADHYIFLLENQHQPEFSTVAYVRRYFAWLCRDKSWQLLDDAISALIGKKGYVLSIGEMVLCDEPASKQLMINKPETVDYISRVEIRKSLIHYKLLSLLSRKLPRMDTLMIDSSWILMDDDMYTLKIFLPSTRLRRIGIVIAPFNYGTGDQTERIILDNDRLLEATSNNGRYILKIESAKERYMSYRKGNENIGNVDKDKDITKGTEQDFLIWIKCEHVEEFTIVGGLDDDVNWQPTFENCALEELTYKQAKYNLLNFQFVCRSWRKPAQKLMFKDIQLTPANSAKFIQCIQHDVPQQVASAVRSLLLVGSFSPVCTVADVVKPIFKHCPNIEELCAINTDVERQLWNYLMLTDEPLKLTKIIEHEMEEQIYYSLYLTVAHKFKQHLHQLCLQFDGSDDTYHASLLVGDQLQRFVALRHLSIRTLCSFKVMETMLDSCPRTTRKLTMNAIDVRDLVETRQSWRSDLDFSTIARNESIQELSCFLLIFTSTLLKYFAYKLKALKKIDLRTFDTNEARSQIMRVCDSLDSYKLALLFRRMPIMPEAAIQEWVRHVLDQSKHHRVERFCLDLDFISGVMVAISPWILQISSNMATSEIVLNYVKMNKLAEVVSDEIEPTYLGLLLQQCKPRLIQIKGVDNIQQHRRWIKEGRSDLFAYSGERSWRFFDAAVHQQEDADIQINDIHLSLSDAFRPPMQGQVHSCRVSKLHFYNSILHSTSFALISQRLSALGTLLIDACHLINHPHPFTFKVSLPATDIGLLSLKVASRDAYSDMSNIQLLNATSDSGHYTLVIETETKTYVSYVEGNSKLSSDSRDGCIPVQGTKDLYLVWIECKALKELALSNDTRTLYVQLEATE
ncbi:hypothetical protein MBANPS3_005655 [Mucor bainieri]